MGGDLKLWLHSERSDAHKIGEGPINQKNHPVQQLVLNTNWVKTGSDAEGWRRK